MEKEKIAAIILVTVIVVALSGYLAMREGFLDDLNLFPKEPKEKETVEIGDCIILNYTGKLANGTVFDSSYLDQDNKTDGTPLKVYVNPDKTISAPEGYETYSSDLIEGFMDGLFGLKEGDEVTIGPIPPEKAYGTKAAIGDTFKTSQIMMNANNPSLSMNITVEITNLSNEFMDLYWKDVEELDRFTMPEGIINDLNSYDQTQWITLVPPYYIWENSTEIVEITDETVNVTTTPTSTENITEEIRPIQYGTIITFIFPDATTVTYDNDTITISNDPVVGSLYVYTIDFYGQTITANITVEKIDTVNDLINISVSYEGFDKEYQNFNKTMSFERDYSIPRSFNMIPSYYASMLFEQDLKREGISLHELASETLYFEVTIDQVFKTSQS